jgi:hypothetical protein
MGLDDFYSSSIRGLWLTGMIWLSLIFVTLFGCRVDTLGLTLDFPKEKTSHHLDTVGRVWRLQAFF